MRDQIKQRLDAKVAETKAKWAAFDACRTEIKSIPDFDAVGKDKEKFEEANRLHAEYEAAASEQKGLETAFQGALKLDGVEAPTNPLGAGEPEGKADPVMNGAVLFGDGSPGDRLLRAPEYKALVESGVLGREKARVEMKAPVEVLSRDEAIALVSSDVEVKTLLTAGGSPGTELTRAQRLPGIIPLRQAPLQMTSLLTTVGTDSDVVEWVRMSAIANNAAEVNEATATTGTSGTKPESGMTFTPDQTNMQIIAHWIPSTKKALADMPALRGIVDFVLLDGVRRRLNGQILNGDGVTPNLRGILQTPDIQSQEYGTGNVDFIEAIFMAMTKVRLAFFEPTGILMNPLDWQGIRLIRDESAGSGTGAYMFGPPSQVGADTLWGQSVVQDVTIEQGTALVGQFSTAILYVREGVSIIATDSHEDFFVRNMVAVLAEGRWGVAVPFPSAFCEVVPE